MKLELTTPSILLASAFQNAANSVGYADDMTLDEADLLLHKLFDAGDDQAAETSVQAFKTLRDIFQRTIGFSCLADQLGAREVVFDVDEVAFTVDGVKTLSDADTKLVNAANDALQRGAKRVEELTALLKNRDADLAVARGQIQLLMSANAAWSDLAQSKGWGDVAGYHARSVNAKSDGMASVGQSEANPIEEPAPASFESRHISTYSLEDLIKALSKGGAPVRIGIVGAQY